MPDTIFMIHGMWGGGWMWDNYKQFFESKGYHCIAPTLPFHDVDPKAPPAPELGAIGVPEYIAFLEGELARLDEKPILLGHSMGALLAQILAARNLGKKNIFLSSAPPGDVFALKLSSLYIFSATILTWGFWRKPFTATYNTYVWGVLNRTPEQEHRPLFESLVPEAGPAAWQIAFPLLDGARATLVDETKVTAPTLICVGEEDRITPASMVAKIAKKYSATAKFKIFKNHAHYLLGEEDWESVAEYLHDWIKKN